MPSRKSGRDPSGRDLGTTRAARALFCPRCHANIFTGLDQHFGGIAVDVDVTPLSALGEALALLAGRRTYSLSWVGDRYEIDRRDQWRIRGTPAGTRAGVDIVTQHFCGAGALPGLPVSRYRPGRVHAGSLVEPPF